MLLTALLLAPAALLQAPPPPPPPPLPPLFAVLDVNQDGVLDAKEIANASASLKKLDKNGDGRLSPEEYRPARPDGAGSRPPERKPEGQPRPQRQLDGPPRPPIDSVLEENGDEIIDAAELAKAPLLLKKLDANGDGKLTREECLPKRPTGQGRPGEAGK